MTPALSEVHQERLRRVKLVIVDNDGVLTDGRIVLGDKGDEFKFFDVQDGHGLVMLHRAGIKTVMISGKESSVNKRRMKELQFDALYEKALDKLEVFEKVLKKFKVRQDEVCYVGDDLIDLPPMRRSGFAVAVSNAVPEVKEAAHYTTERSGGRGAVRETIDLLLKTKGLWNEAVARYFR